MPKEFAKFWITQAGMIIKDDKCLVVELAGKKGNWDIPGGRMDIGEENESEKAFSAIEPRYRYITTAFVLQADEYPHTYD